MATSCGGELGDPAEKEGWMWNPGAYTDLFSSKYGVEVLHPGAMIAPAPEELQEDLFLSIPASGASH